MNADNVPSLRDPVGKWFFPATYVAGWVLSCGCAALLFATAKQVPGLHEAEVFVVALVGIEVDGCGAAHVGASARFVSAHAFTSGAKAHTLIILLMQR
jgi:hypothetical protein